MTGLSAKEIAVNNNKIKQTHQATPTKASALTDFTLSRREREKQQKSKRHHMPNVDKCGRVKQNRKVGTEL